MTLTDIIALAKNGYKPSDIKELLELAQPAEPDEGDPAREEDPEMKKEQDPDPEPEKKTEPETDALRAEIVQLQDKIKELQAENTKKDIGGKIQTDEEKFEELVKNFY